MGIWLSPPPFSSSFLNLSLKWCSLQRKIVTLSSAPILRSLRHSFYKQYSYVAIVSSPRGFLRPSFVLQTSVVSYSFFKRFSSDAIVSLPRGFLSPSFVLRTTVVAYSLHKRSTSAAIVGPFIVSFTNGLRIRFVLRTIPIGCHIQPILNLY